MQLISEELIHFGVSIEILEGGDGFEEIKIEKIF